MSQLPADTQDNAHNRLSHVSQIAQEGVQAFDRALTSGDIAAAVQVATYTSQLREALEPVMPALMELCDSPLGFRTDRHPDILAANKRKKRGPTEPYPPAVVKECAMEALLRGVKLVGDQFNIISGRCYIPLNGYRLLINSTAATNFRYTISKVEITENEHIAEGRAEWVIDGQKYEMQKEFFCKAFGHVTTWEQTEGKATRKLFKAVYERITGKAFHDEEDEEIREGLRRGAIDVGGGEVKATKPEQLLEMMAESETHPHEFIAYLKGKGAASDSVESIHDLNEDNPELVEQLVATWEKSEAKFKRETKSRAEK